MIQIRKAEDRGHFNHGWLDTHFTAATDPSTQLVLVIEGVR